jgi:hypothetical protein
VRNGAEGLHESADGSRESAETASSREAGHESESDDAAARSVLESLSARGQQRARSNGSLAGTKSARHRSIAGDALQDSAGAGTRASAAAIGEATDFSRVNWLHDYAMYTLPPTPTRGRLFLQYVFTPTINYRTLSGGDFNTSKELGSPVALMHPGNVTWADNSPALGFEFGGNLLYRVTRNLTVKGGLQFNFSRYRIMDSITSFPTAGNIDDKTRETLYNNYFQISAPVGFELRVLGNERLQFNLGATVQPFYLLNTNPYMLTTDNDTYTARYTKDPSLLRRWNVSGALEAFLSYQAGPIRWQIGPEFRYQLLSTYNSGYPINENLKGYGIKIGITKPLP